LRRLGDELPDATKVIRLVAGLVLELNGRHANVAHRLRISIWHSSTATPTFAAGKNFAV
jgi:hypothetical protein